MSVQHSAFDIVLSDIKKGYSDKYLMHIYELTQEELDTIKGDKKTNLHFPQLVNQEINRARKLHANINSLHEAYAVILEELEEFKTEVFKKTANRNTKNMLEELVQIAAMCQKTAEDLKLI